MEMFGLFVLTAASFVFSAMNMLVSRADKRGDRVSSFFQATYIASFVVLLGGPIVFLVLSATTQ